LKRAALRHILPRALAARGDLESGVMAKAASVSFEFFPPKTPAMAANLWRSVERLGPLGPRFVSVTYGAGGTTRERTIAAVGAIRDLARLDVAGHLTCVGATAEATLEVARQYRAHGCTRIVALRGDPPKGEGRFTPHPGGFASSVALVEALARDGWSRILVSAYPEPHPEARTAQDDLDTLRRKVDAGATEALTQFFFDNETYLRFRDACAAAGLAIPIHPGVLPIENFDKMRGFAESCGASVPDRLHRAFAACADAAAARRLAVEVAATQCAGLIAEGVPHIHLYTLNNADIPFEVCAALGVTPAPARAAAAGAA
jgi:methylenetetrahydrofolate reductase (NADPH)